MVVQIPVPDRPLTLETKVRRPSFFDVFSMGFVAALMFTTMFFGLPGLVADTVAGDFAPAEDVSLEGDCFSKTLVALCSVTLRDESQERVDHVGYFGYAPVRAMPGRAANGTLVANFAQENLINRWLLFLGFTGGFGALLFFGSREMLRNWRVYREARTLRDARLSAEHVQVLRWDNNFAEYRRLDGGRTYTATMVAEFEPLFSANVEDGSALAMAVSRAGGGPPVLVDANLSVLDLTEDERETVFRKMTSNFEVA